MSTPDLNLSRLNDADQRLQSFINRSQRLITTIEMGQRMSNTSSSAESSSNSDQDSSANLNVTQDLFSTSALQDLFTGPNADETTTESGDNDGQPGTPDSQSTIPDANMGNDLSTEAVVVERASTPLSQPRSQPRPLEEDANEVIVLDDTITDEPIQNNYRISDSQEDLVYVQTIQNPVVPIIDLCTQVDPEHSYSRLVQPTESRRRRRRQFLEDLQQAVNRERSRSPITAVDHSYADPAASAAQMPPPPVQSPNRVQSHPRVLIVPAAPVNRPAPSVPDLDLSQASQNESFSQLGTCPICLEKYFRRQPHSTLCGHVFCKSCIFEAIKSTKSCPLCRKKLTMKNIHPIHF